MENKEIVKRDEKGRYLKGSNPNPKGRGLGTPNKMTIIRQQLDTELADAGMDVLTKCLEVAKKGDSRMLIALLDRLVPKPSAQHAHEKGNIKIEITNLSGPTEKRADSGVVIEGNTVEQYDEEK